MKSLYDFTRRQYIRMWITYGSVFVLVFVAGYFLSRDVINQPWTARTHMGTAVIEDLLYVVGGQLQGTGELLDDVWELDPDQARLRAVAQLPYPCYLPETAVSQDKLFILGGYDGDAYRSEILQVIRGETETIASLPSPRAYGAGIGVGNTLYYAGGWDGTNVLDEIVAIDLASSTVVVVAHLPSPRRFVTAAYVGDMIYFVGGEGVRSEFLDEVIEFDPIAQQTVRIGHLPTGRYLVSAITRGDDLLVLGGKNTRSVDEVVLIDLSGVTITSGVIDKISELAWNLSVKAIEDRVFIIGGEHPNFKRAIGLAEYTPEDSPPLISIRLRKNPWN